MRARLFLAFGWAALALAAPSAAPAAVPAQKDWSKTVAATPEGGFRMGNPNAPVKLVEYGSLTCPHCAAFSEQGVPPLIQNYVRTGQVSYEFRNLVRDPYDIAAALISRCAGPSRFFPLTEEIFANQWRWTAPFASKAEAERISKLPPAQRFVKIAEIGGLDKMAARFGVPATKANACLTNSKSVDRLIEMNRVANTKFKIDGTPNFIVNGTLAKGVYNWGALEPLLRPKGG